MHLYELLACFALISSVLVCVVLHRFLEVCGIYQDFGFGLALSGWGYGLAPLAYTVISAMASCLYLWSCQDERIRLRYEAVQHCGGVVWSV